MNRKILQIFFIIGVIIASSCNNHIKTEDGRVYIDNNNIRRVGSLDTAKWNCYENINNINNICIPKSWNIEKTNLASFFARVDSLDNNCFFIVVDYSNANLTIKQYLKDAYEELSADTVEIFVSYNIKELELEQRTVYYVEYLTILNGIKYFSYSMCINEDGYIYDIALKVRDKKKNEYYESFQNILYNVWINKKHIFSESNGIISIKQIKYNEL